MKSIDNLKNDNMKTVKTFKGFRYNPEKVDIKKTVAPPYDVFNYGDRTDARLRTVPGNIVHVQKPQGDGSEKYKNARDTYADFINKEILIREEHPGFYIVRQSWGDNSRTGFIAAVKLDPEYRRIKRHEKTKSAPIADRFDLTKSTGLNIGSIFVVFDDDDGSIADLLKKSSKEKNMLYNFNFPEDINNRVYLSQNSEISQAMEHKTLYIADGHHRYRTMLDYRDYMRRKEGNPEGERPYDYTMMFLVPSSEILILPYHRLIRNISPELIDKLQDNLKENFIIKKKTDIIQPEKGAIGFYVGGDYLTLTPRKDENNILDSELLQNKIFDKYLNITEEDMRTGDSVHYKPGNEDLSQIKDLIDSGKYQAAFILNPPSFKEIKKIADNDETMPPKSTYFYPKIPTGIVLNKVT